MVQVDVFWSYGIGASFALAAFRQLRKLKVENEISRWKLGWKREPVTPAEVAGEAQEELREREKGALAELLGELRNNGFSPGKLDLKRVSQFHRVVKAWMDRHSDAFHNEYFLKTLLFLALLFVPSGSVLLWSNPNWETMQVGSYETIPAWLVGVFTTTNITQGLLGFWATYRDIMKGNYYRAALHTMLAYIGFFFILANGWDNKGYQRFFSANREAFENWKWTNVFGWLKSDVVRILLTYGVAFIPLIYYWICKWLIEGYDMEAGREGEVDLFERLPEATRPALLASMAIFGGALGSAILATVLIHNLGWARGLAIYAAVMGWLLSRWGPGPLLTKRLLGVEDLHDVPVEELVREKMEELEKEKVAV